MKKLRGFTLVELIVVMAIFSILMVCLMNMMKPIRSTYTETTYYSSHVTVQQGIMKYISESIRCAENVGIYNNVSRDDALTAFCTLTGISDTDPEYQRVNIITIDNTPEADDTDPYYGCGGRLYRSKKNDIDNDRLAFGKAFYGKTTYSILLEESADSDQGLTLKVSSVLPYGERKARRNDTNIGTDEVTASYYCMTLEDYIECSNTKARKFEINCPNPTTDPSTKTYIVFMTAEYDN